MTIFLVEINKFGFETGQSGKLSIDIIIWIFNRIAPTTTGKPFISSNVLVLFLKSLSLWPFNELVLVIVHQSHGDSMK